MSGKAYSVLADIYDALTDEELYIKWKNRVLEVLAAYPRFKRGLDVACGSGFFTVAEKKAGYSVTGVDFSREMLEKAQENALKENLSINFIESDMSELKVFEKVDFITVVNDGVNYVSDEKLKKAFSKFYNALNDGGVLYFDFSTAYRLENVIGNNVFAEDYDDMTFLWFNAFKGDRVEMDMTVFKRSGGQYLRFDESHVQYVHTLDFIEKTLYSVGFKRVVAKEFLAEDVKDTTERIEIIAEK